ncbi:Outer membrane protein TolC [Tepidimonas thermarum]|uniref:Outer membrane protein TolC n=1 Tax=Tepidimonas thermarum TaxID=335431 RepID=A0A554X4M4_9BURK|nr:TolC family outer membrane protein [Tepidimonas thermarum]TSE30768.1 Outer membrane protein TolC [Tepidimonas thermarum]
MAQSVQTVHAAAASLRRRLTAWGAAGALCASAALAQPVQQAPSAAPLDVVQAYQLARDHDARVRAARAAAQAQRERLPQAQAQLRPQLALGASRLHNDLTRTSANLFGQPVTQDERYWSENATLSLRQPLYRPALTAGVAVAQAQVADADAVLAVEENQLAARVAQAYLEVLQAQDQLELVQVQQRVAQIQLDAARQALERGTGTRTDVDDIAARLDLLGADALRAQQQIEQARRQLQAITGPFDRPLAPMDHERIELAPLQPPDLQAWLDRAEAASPELAALRARADAAQREIDRASAGHLPTLDLIFQLTRSASENVTSPSSRYTNRAVGVQFNMPLYSGGYIDSAVRQAVAEYTRAQETLESTRRDLFVRVAEQHQAVIQGQQRVQALRRAVESARTAVRSSEASLRAGVRTVLDVLDAQQRLSNAERELRLARYQTLLARLRLSVLAGDTGEAELQTLQAQLLQP